MFRSFLMYLAMVLPLAAQPVIKALQNNYSYIVPGLPNYGIAEGSIFIIMGTGLATGSTGLQTTYPLPKTLLGTSVSVTVSGTVTVPILYYVLPTQIAAILPSTTPVGMGVITVTNNGQTSATFPIQVVQSAFGILTYYGTGSGFAAAFDNNFPATASPYLGVTSAANPGEVLTLWGSGIGPDPGNPDETVTQKLNNLVGSFPIEVDIGGISSTILYAGRSLYPGLDQINVYLPANVTPGCHVSVIVKTGNVVSNSTSIQVAANGRTCSDPNIGYTAAELATITAKANIKVGIIGIGRRNQSDQVVNGLNAYFNNYSNNQFLTQPESASYGSCVIVPAAATLPFLDAGASIKVTGPGGETAIIDKTSGSIYNGGFTTSFISNSGGAFSFSNGAGGTDVGVLSSASTTIPGEATWTNLSSLSSISRSQGFTVTWTPNSANGFVTVHGTSPTADGSITQTFECAASMSAGQITVPPSLLLAVPASNSGQLVLYTYALPVSFIAAGLDAGFVVGEINTTIATAFK
jgi:uncharacterized protein (TIGR03437 family)